MDCIVIGYANNSSAYHFLVHKSETSNFHKNTIMESRKAMFRLEKDSSSVKLSLGTISKNGQDQREEIDMSLDVTKGLKHQLPLVRTF